jgi:GT2 family glycosyltransferase
MDVSVIIVSYNTQALLRQCLRSVFEQTREVQFEVIVVDNASHDGSPEMVREEFPNVTLVESENKGFGHANNLGAKRAKGRYLFLLNPDTVVLNNAVKILVDFLENNPKAGICGGNLFDADGRPTLSYETFLPTLSWELGVFFIIGVVLWKLRHGKNIRFNHTHLPRKVGYVLGADLMIRHDLFRRLNGFDADFFVYYEEVELTFRVKKAGYEVYSVPQAEIVHLEGQSFSNDDKRREMLSLNGRELYYQKTYNPVSRLVMRMIILSTCLLRIVVFTLLRDRSKRRPWIDIFKHYVPLFR